MQKYGITLKQRTTKLRPADINVNNNEGSRVVRSAAKRVIATHQKVIKALANR